MKLLLRLILGKPLRAKKPKKHRKNLLLLLLDKLAGIPLTALELKWNEDLWKPDF